MKRILCFTVAMLLAVLLCVNVSAAESDGFNYSVTTDGCTVHKYIGDDNLVFIPERLSGYSVYAISEGAFKDLNFLNSVSTPDCIRIIHANAFSDCKNLGGVGLGADLTRIGSSAFNGCIKIKTISLPSKLEVIEGSAFEGCTALDSVYATSIEHWISISFSNQTSNPTYYAKNLYVGEELVTSVEIPSRTTTIKSYNFINCEKIEKVTIPKSVSLIGGFAFDGCTGITDVYFDGTEADKEKLTIATGNDALLNATWHFGGEGGDGTVSSLDGLGGSNNNNDGPNLTLIIIIATTVVAVAGGVVAILIIKKKKK